MFDDVDQSLRALLVADVPLDPTEVEISFARPTREWSSRLAGPTLNLFLYDVRERTDFRDDAWRVTQSANGTVTRERAPRRIDLSYVVTAWTREPEDEHRILGRVLACLYRNHRLPEEHAQGVLSEAVLPVLLRTMPPDHLQKSVDFWGVMDNELRAGLTWVATAPLDAFAPETGPMVLTRDIRSGPLATPDDRRQGYLIGGALSTGGESPEAIPGARITVQGTAIATRTREQGRYLLSELNPGDYTLRIEPPEGPSFDHPIVVPSPSYDIVLPTEDPPEEPARPTRRRPRADT